MMNDIREQGSKVIIKIKATKLRKVTMSRVVKFGIRDNRYVVP